jgi:hypothetical protein
MSPDVTDFLRERERNTWLAFVAWPTPDTFRAWSSASLTLCEECTTRANALTESLAKKSRQGGAA